jgi:hypothetical protein
MKKILLTTGLLFALSANAELVQQFKDPTFSGNGWTTQVLTLQQMQKTQKESLEAQEAARKAAALAAESNTPLARFMSLFQSQVYAQLSTQLSNNLFQNNCKGADGAAIPGCVPPTAGTFTLDGNTVSWEKSTTNVKLTVVDSAGTVTIINVPIANFAF